MRKPSAYDFGLDILGGMTALPSPEPNPAPEPEVSDISEADAEASVIALMRAATRTEFTEAPELPRGNLIDNVLGFSFDWTDIFNPAGAGIRYYEESQQKPVTASAAGAGASTSGKLKAGKPSPAVAASLATSKAKLAALQHALTAAHLQALQSSTSTAASLVPSMATSPMSTDDQTDNQDSTVMGFPSDELDDILLETYQKEITDEPPDYERRRASVHRGAAYLQDIDYPPHGASGGQEGGMIMPSNKVEIFGGHHYSRGLDVLGAAASSGAKAVVKNLGGGVKSKVVPQRAGFVAKTTPAGRVHTSLAVNPHKTKDQKTSIKNARTAGQRAISVGNKINQKLTAATKVHGAPAPAKVGAPKISHLVATQLKQMVDKTVKKGKAQLAAADKHEKLVNAATGKLKAGVQKVAAKLDPSGKTKIHGHVAEEAHEVLGIFCEDVLGAALPDPSNPGYLMDGTPDPNYGSTGAPPDPSNPGYLMDGTPDPNYGTGAVPTSGVPGPPDYGLGPAPTGAPVLQPGLDFMPDPGADGDISVYSSTGDAGTVPLPDGAVIYDGSQAMPEKAVGSYTFFHGKLPTGKGPDFGDGSGFFWGGDNAWHYWGSSFYNDGIAIDLRTKSPNAEESASLPVLAKSSQNHNWGPLCGNPKNHDFAGLRYDIGGNQWFWYRDKAPKWATAADDQQRANQAILDYQTQFTAAQTDYVAQKAQDALDAQNAAALAKQQAAEDAQAARQMQQEQAQAQHQADLEALQANQQAQQQQLADDAAARQAQAQSQIDIQQAMAQAEIERKAQAAQDEADRQAMQTQADIEARAAEAAAQLQAMQPPDDGGDGGPADDSMPDDEEGGWGSQNAMARSMLDDDTDMMGHVSGSDRLQRRRF